MLIILLLKVEVPEDVLTEYVPVEPHFKFNFYPTITISSLIPGVSSTNKTSIKTSLLLLPNFTLGIVTVKVFPYFIASVTNPYTSTKDSLSVAILIEYKSHLNFVGEPVVAIVPPIIHGYS